ncbi:hypothetical protein SO802_031176 [Lithocarpus litseifolius]|uniref:Uncharacterized protein n=1 Tax=Lithocarpus litseifolius TaxID=425828 RepID=A0AAW2BJQ4_9ROSI
MMANEDVLFSNYDVFISEYKEGEADIVPELEWSSNPLLKIKLSHPSKIPRPSPTPIPTPPPTIDSNLQPQIIELDPFPVPKWFLETEGTDFEFVRLVKMKLMSAAGVHFKIQFEDKPRAAAEYTLKTFEGFVFKDCVFHHKVWPESCRLLSPNRDSVYDEESRRPMFTYEVVSGSGPPSLHL